MTWDLFNERITSMTGATQDEAGSFPGTVNPDDPVLKWTNFLKNPTLPTFLVMKPPPDPPKIGVPLVSAICGVFGVIGLLILLRRKGEMPRWAGIGTVLAFIGVAAFWPLAQIPMTNPMAEPPAVTDDEASKLIGSLLRNVYRAFDYRDESRIYDALARSASGELLGEIYSDISLQQTQGGARVKVEKIDILETKREAISGEAGFRVRCKWNLTGKINHWGHGHTRINQYEAAFTVRAVDGSWKITRQEVGGAKRVR